MVFAALHNFLVKLFSLFICFLFGHNQIMDAFFQFRCLHVFQIENFYESVQVRQRVCLDFYKKNDFFRTLIKISYVVFSQNTIRICYS